MVVEAEEIIALALVFVVHVAGGVMLVWALIDTEQRAAWRRRWGWGGHGDDPPAEPPSGGGGGTHAPAPSPLPLPSGAPSRVRLREPVRAGDAYGRPGRRPAHPERPARVPERRDSSASG
jgi:hypothetical protein